MTTSERKRLKVSHIGCASLLLYLIIPLGGTIIIALFVSGGAIWLLEKLGLALSDNSRQWVFIAGLLIGSVVGVASAWSLFQFFRQGSQLEKRDLEDGVVEVITVSQPVVIQQEERNDEGPIYFFDIGAGKILFLCGQWIYDDQIYETCAIGKDGGGESEADWPPFPCEGFAIYRAPHSGKVLQIDLNGQKLKPTRVIKANSVRLTDGNDSLLFEGSLDDLSSAMSKARRGLKRQKHGTRKHAGSETGAPKA